MAAPTPKENEDRPTTEALLENQVAVDREFAHADDFSWVQGRLEYRHRTREWHIRFAPHWQEERYGGSLALSGSEEAQNAWKEGQRVRLWGGVKGDDSPIYQVDRTDRLQPATDPEG